MLMPVNDAIPEAGIPLIFYYHRLNCYSFNALAGAMDTDAALARWPVSLAKTGDDLKAAARSLSKNHDRILVALSVLTPQFPEIRDLIRELRRSGESRLTFLAGGPHVTARAEELLDAGADIAFRGEAEVSFPEVLRRLARGRDFSDVPGIVFRQGQSLMFNPPARHANLDSFSSGSPRLGMFGPIEITRGCPFACSFCQTSQIFGVQPRHRSIDSIVRQASALRSRGRKVVRVLSPNAFSYGSEDGRRLNVTAIGELLAALRETVSAGGRIIFGHYPSEVRPEHVNRETMSLLRRYADNDEIVIGAQSGSLRMLETCRRAHTVESVVSAVSLARKCGYKIIVDFMFGLPGESPEDERESIAMMNDLARMGARIHPHAFVPLPQTAFSAERPGRVSAAVIQALRELKQAGAIYGDWTVQRRLADRLYRQRPATHEP